MTTLTYPPASPRAEVAQGRPGGDPDRGAELQIVGDHGFAAATFRRHPARRPHQPPTSSDPAQTSRPPWAVPEKYVFLAADYNVSFVDVVRDEHDVDARRSRSGSARPSTGCGVIASCSAPATAARTCSRRRHVGIRLGARVSYQYPGGLNLDAIAPPPPK
jgi:hypothetical protein